MLKKYLIRSRIGRRFWEDASARWALRGVVVLALIALLADLLANEVPLFVVADGSLYFPAFRAYLVDLGLAGWNELFLDRNWTNPDYEFVLRAPVPYSAATLDLANSNYVGPFGKQYVESLRYRHWLGTDELGRDVLAGMISGTRVALLVGLIAMSVATLVGGLMGSLAGYFGDDTLRTSWLRVLGNLLAIYLAWLWGIQARTIANESWGGMLLSLLLMAALFTGINFLIGFFEKQKNLRFPVDLIVMRLVEIFNAVPGLLLLLAVIATLHRPTIFHTMLLIGLLRWTGVARFLRGEMLRVRQLDYVESARALGFGHGRIIRRHVLPNALQPVLITISFGVASAILLEAALSFIGIGTGDTVTWGKLLAGSRSYFSAWWLAIFPGIAIFMTVTLFNLLGEGLSRAMRE